MGARRVAIVAALAVLFYPLVAPASIQEQRERLPPPAEGCTDPVAGVWKSHAYDPRYGDWTIFLLNVRRKEGSETELVGTIVNHSWDASPTDQEPPPCSSGRGEWVVSMDAHGTIDAEGRIFFGGQGQWRLDRVVCNWGPGGYNLDNFTGLIDPALQEFQSVNNDGGRAVNEPTVFRRISCFDPSEQNPRVVSTPPPFYPSTRGGCSR
jgi:hypothetical protein